MAFPSHPVILAFNPFYVGPYPTCAAYPCDFDIYKNYNPGRWTSTCYRSY